MDPINIPMNTQFVHMRLDIFCQWTEIPPRYRIFVNDEMVTERTWRLSPTQYIQENIPLRLAPGEYTIRLENLTPTTSEFKQRNLSSSNSNVIVDSTKTFRVIDNESV